VLYILYTYQMSQKLTYEECIKIQVYLEEWLKHRPIAKKLGRSNSSISDEIRKYSVNGQYNAWMAWIVRKARREIVNALHCKIQRWDPLDEFIFEKVKSYRSPEQIAWAWKNESWEIVSKDTVYRHIKKVYPELIKKYFRRWWKKYKYWTIKASHIHNRVSIHERPIAAKLKSEFGHWEWDTMRGAKRIGWFATFTERKCWIEMARVLKEKTASNVTNWVCELFNRLPEGLKKTITLDNGTEFVEHYMWKLLCDLDTYFADVGKAWQRGLNENTNGLLRQFFPKGTDLANVTQEELDYYLDLLNNRPRKRLWYLSPIQYLEKYCADLN